MWKQYPISDKGHKIHVLIIFGVSRKMNEQISETNKCLESRLESDMWQKYAILWLRRNLNILHVLSMQPSSGSQVELNVPTLANG